MEPRADLDRLRTIVRDFRIHWRVSPEYVYVGDERRHVGFNLELGAAHRDPHERVAPGCPKCIPLKAALTDVIQFILPREERDSVYEVHVAAQRLTYPSGHPNAPEVIAEIQILHRSEFQRPVDACEERCLAEMTAALKDLGSPEGPWRPAVA